MPARKSLPLAAEAGPPEPVEEPRTFDPSRLSIFIVALLAGSALFLSGFTLGSRLATTPGTPASEEARFAPFWDVYSLIQKEYAGSPRPSGDQLVQSAIRGMMESLDDYSYYQSPEDFRRALLNVGGQDEGVGVQVQLQPTQAGGGTTQCSAVGNGCELAIVKPLPDSPAETAGLRPGDLIVAVDGASLDGLSLDQVASRIRGPRDTSVTLTIQRGSTRQDVTIVRKVYNRPEVDTEVLANGAVQYIEIYGINGPAYSQFRLALSEALAAGRRSIILDLRNNGGGYVPDAVYIASQFISSKTLFYQEDAAGTLTEIGTKTKPDEPALALDPSIEVVVLVDGSTVSAAEILAGVLQAHGRARLVGRVTYGKGLVQEWLPLPNNQGGISLTVAHWLLPDKTWIQGKGLTPDIPVSGAGARAGTDPILDAGLVALGYQPSAASSPTPSASPLPSLSPSPSPAAS